MTPRLLPWYVIGLLLWTALYAAARGDATIPVVVLAGVGVWMAVVLVRKAR